MIKFGDTEFVKLSEITGIADYDLRKLYHMGLLKDHTALRMLVKRDFRNIYRKKLYTRSQIADRLTEYYRAEKCTVYAAINATAKSQFFCVQCKGKIPRAMYVRNKGLCDKCVSKSIEIPT